MSLPQSRLLTRLQGIAAVTAIVNQNIFPELVPTLPQYPAVVFQVLANKPFNDAGGGSDSALMTIQVSCLAITAGPKPAYEQVWELANAVAGIAEADAGPTGLSGWKDNEKSIWHLQDEFDEAGEIRAGTESFWAFVVNQIYTLQWIRN
jgi:Protein of unknown function (DUF3168)